MYCSSCRGSTRIPGARYCARCGAPLQSLLWSEERAASRPKPGEPPAADGAVICRHCERANPEESMHCTYCGFRLEAGPSARQSSEEDRERARDLIGAARESLARGQSDTARTQCVEALSYDPNNAAGHALLSDLLRQEGSLGEALQEMTLAGRLAPENRDYERRLRELREEADQALAPMLRNLEEPRMRRRPRPRRPRQPRAPMRVPELRLPQWVKAALLIGGIMLLAATLPGLLGNLRGFLGLLLGALVTIFVYRDARAQGLSQAVALLWAGAILLTFAWGPGIIVFLIYLIYTRSRR